MIHNATELMGYIQQVGFLPLLYSGIPGYSADESVDPDCRYVLLDDGSWDWPLWDWKGPIVTEGDCVYGKFFNKKAGFVSRLYGVNVKRCFLMSYSMTTFPGKSNSHC